VLDSTATVKVSLKDGPPGAILNGSPADGVAAVNGLATFNTLNLNLAGTRYTLRATATGLDAKVTDTFNVLPGQPTLHFLDANGNPTDDPIGSGPFPVGSRLPTIIVEADATKARASPSAAASP
jgi:hypothetical protein